MSDTLTVPEAAQAGSRSIEVVPVTGSIGAEIRGVTLSGDLDAATISDIRAALR